MCFFKNTVKTIIFRNFTEILSNVMGSRGLMDRALDLKPKVVGSNPGSGRKSMTAPRPLQCRLPTAPSVCVHLDELNAENTFHSSLYSVLIVYVTNKVFVSASKAEFSAAITPISASYGPSKSL